MNQSTHDRDQVNMLRTAAITHANCLLMHAPDPTAIEDDINYVMNQADWLAEEGNAQIAWKLLKEGGIGQVCDKHLQYFLSCCPPMPKAYAHLHQHIAEELQLHRGIVDPMRDDFQSDVKVRYRPMMRPAMRPVTFSIN
jgi:hypothetical protein